MGRFGDIFNDTRFDFGTFEVKRDFVNEYGDVATLGRGFVSDFNASMDYALGIRNSLYDESDFPTRVDDRPIFDGEDTRHIGYETADAMRRAVHSTAVPQSAPQLATQDVIRNASSTGAEMFNQGFDGYNEDFKTLDDLRGWTLLAFGRDLSEDEISAWNKHHNF